MKHNRRKFLQTGTSAAASLLAGMPALRTFDIQHNVALTMGKTTAAVYRVPGAVVGPPVGWSLEFNNQQGLRAARMTLEGRYGAANPSSKLADVRVENGMLHLGVKDLPGRDPNQYVVLSWKITPNVDIRKFPIIEIRWRTDRAQHVNPSNTYEDLPTYFLKGRLCLANGEPSFGLQAEPNYRSEGWQVSNIRFAPDSSFPGSWTPRWLTGIRLECAAWMRKGPAWFEVDYIRVRAFTREEAATDQVVVQHLKGYRPPELSEHLKKTFLYGVFGRPMYIGGWEGAFDELARRHMNYVLGAGINPAATLPPIPAIPAPYTEPGTLPKYAAALRETAKSAELRGINLIMVPSNPRLTNLLEAEGPEPVEKEVAKLAEAAKDLPSIVGWYVQDEPSPPFLWGVIGTKQIYERLDPERLAFITFNNPASVRYYDRFLTIVVGDRHPITTTQKKPWVIGEWCREINKASKRRQWFDPQAVGGTDYWKSPSGYGVIAYPDRETFRAMMYLALANGVKGFAIYIFWDMMGVGLADLVGNPTVLMEEATRIGEKWMPIGPLLLDAKPIAEPVATGSKASGASRGLSVGALGDSATGPLFLVVLNEDLKGQQSGQVTLPEVWVRSQRAVYDLYGLRRVAAIGAKSFAVESLEPADGRVYMLGTESQYNDARRDILKNRVEENVRVQNADRIIAERWGLNLNEYDVAVKRVRNLLKAGKNEEALLACDEVAAKRLQEILASSADLINTSKKLELAREDLGKANLAIYYGWHSVREGRQNCVGPFEQLCKRYDELRHRYLFGEHIGLMSESSRLAAEARSLLNKASRSEVPQHSPHSHLSQPLHCKLRPGKEHHEA